MVASSDLAPEKVPATDSEENTNGHLSTDLAADTVDPRHNSTQTSEQVDTAQTLPATITKPIEHVSDGIQPVAAFLPRDVPIHSHPTPPPDHPLKAATTDTDVEMTNGDEDPTPRAEVDTLPATLPAEASLVRLREEEDDGDDARSVKRSRVIEGGQNEASVNGIHASGDARGDAVTTVAVSNDGVSGQSPNAPIDHTNEASHDARPVLTEASGDNSAADELALDSLAPATEATPINPDVSDSIAVSIKPQPPSTPLKSATTDSSKPAAESRADISSNLPPSSSSATKYSESAITPLQKAFIADKMKNLKKTKHSIAFLRPVDYVALNIPGYPDIIKQPMDLGTMESKLKADQYRSVQDFVNDFNLIIENCRRFNGDAHPVTQAGLSMEAYFKKMMETVPSPSQAAPIKQVKKRSPSIGSKPLPRREPRAVTTTPAPAPPPPLVKQETFALQADGTPQIRRDSTNRPARAIKPPQSRDLTYAKPKRKEALLELKFCEHILEELRGPKYDKVNSVFLYPVDPVALNIPHYRQIVKHPMDLATMSQKLKHGQYSKAAEFKKDFELMIQNCISFNPQGNPVRDMGVQFQRDFMALWAQKDRWEKANKPEIRGNSHSADEDSGEEEDEDEDVVDDDKEATIQALQKQLLDMQNTIASMAGGGKLAKPKKSKPKTNKKAATSSVLTSKSAKSSASKPKPKKPKQVTYEEKQEISDAVGRMNDSQVTRLTQIITENCARYRDMDEMELEIDDLPNDVQAMLLKYVRGLFGNPTRGRAISPDDMAAMDDDDFEPSARASAGGKHKKHKPMGKREQGEAIKNLQSKLAQFSNGGAGGSGSESPVNHAQQQRRAESSSDEESEESEEE